MSLNADDPAIHHHPTQRAQLTSYRSTRRPSQVAYRSHEASYDLVVLPYMCLSLQLTLSHTSESHSQWDAYHSNPIHLKPKLSFSDVREITILTSSSRDSLEIDVFYIKLFLMAHRLRLQDSSQCWGNRLPRTQGLVQGELLKEQIDYQTQLSTGHK